MSVARAFIQLAASQEASSRISVIGGLCRCGDTRGISKDLAVVVGTQLALGDLSLASLKEPSSWETVFGAPLSAQAYLAY